MAHILLIIIFIVNAIVQSKSHIMVTSYLSTVWLLMIFRMAFLSKGVSTGPPYLGLIAWEIEVAVKKIAVSKIEIPENNLKLL